MSYSIYLLLLISSHALANEEQFLTGNRIFSSELYAKFVASDDNILVSPLSTEIILGLLQSGADGVTASEIRSTLHFASSKEETEAAVKSGLSMILEDAALIMLTTVSLSGDYSINEDFRTVVSDVYKAHIQNGVGGLSVVNEFLYKSNWDVAFSPSTGSFLVNPEERVDIDLIYQESAEFVYGESEELDAKILQIPFTHHNTSMVILLPNGADGLATLEGQLKGALTDSLAFSREVVQVSLPKFMIASVIEMDDILQELGVHDAFDENKADFSGIAGEKGELHVNSVKQETYIQVDESGVNAAITSNIEQVDNRVKKATKTFVVDHPFIFYIQINGIIIAIGRVINPQQFLH